MRTPRKYFPYQQLNALGWHIAYRDAQSDIWTMPSTHTLVHALCVERCDRLNHDQIEEAEKQLVDAQRNWADVQRLLCGKKLME